MSTKHILIIDDDRDIQKATQYSLGMTSDWQAIAATSLKEGLAQAKVRQPDAILLDVKMPDYNSFDILNELKTNSATKSIPIILLSKNLQEQKLSASNGKIAGVITKPFNPLTLAVQIAATLDW